MNGSSSTFARIAMAAVILLAFGLRVWGLGFGLPYFEHPDEWAVIMPAVRILQSGDLNPQRFDYGSFYIYTQTIGLALITGLMKGAGQLMDISQLPVYTPTHRVLAYPFPQVFWTGRLITALLGTATVVPVFLLGRRLVDLKVGVTAAFLVAIWPLHVIDSHFITTDVPLTFFAAVTLLAMTSAFEQQTFNRYLLTGLLLGLTISTKYTGAFMIGVFVLGHFLAAERPWRYFSHLVAAGGASLAGFTLTTPYWLLDWSNFWNWITYVTETYNPQIQTIDGGSAWFYGRMLLSFPETIVVILAVIGSIWGLKRPRTGWWLGLSAIFFVILVSRNVIHQHRVLIPLTPFLALLAALGWNAVAKQAAARWRSTTLLQKTHIYLGAFFLLTIPLLARAVAHDMRFARPGARDLARTWLQENLPVGALAAADFDTPVFEHPGVTVDRVGWSVLAHDPEWYAQNGYTHLIISSSQRFNPNRTREQEESYVNLLENGRFRLVEEIEGHILSYPGHKIMVYERIP